MKCTAGHHTVVVDTREEGDGDDQFTRRRRKCLECDALFSTIEIIIPGTEKTIVRTVLSKPSKKPAKTPRSVRTLYNSAQIKRDADARRRIEEIKDDQPAEYLNELDYHKEDNE